MENLRIINSICQKSDQPSAHFSNSNSYKNKGFSKHEKTFYEHLFQLFSDRFSGFLFEFEKKKERKSRKTIGILLSSNK
jgi:hypothetical protein